MPHANCPRSSIAVALAGLAILPALGLAQTVSPRLLFDVEGSVTGPAVGQCLSRVGDLNGDGYPDFGLGIPSYGPVVSDSTGRVLIYFGGQSLNSVPDLVLEGERRGSQFGAMVEAAGDVNGDGFDDLLVGAPSYRIPNATRGGTGRAYLYAGASSPASAPMTVLESPIMPNTNTRDDGFGIRGCGLGDMDGDGYGDVAIVSDGGWFGPEGPVHIVRGGHVPQSAPFFTVNSPGRGLLSVCGPGDLNGDGFADLVVASPEMFFTQAPLCLVVLYTRLRHQSEERLTLGTSTRNGYGSHLAVVGDLDRDGKHDFVAGHPYSSGGGAAYVYMSASGGLLTLRPPVPLPDSFGTAVSAGDVDGDGTPEILVGAPGSREGGPGAGAVYVYRQAGSAPIGRWTGVPGDYFGYSLAVPGDLDRNGGAELLVGSPRRPGLAARNGRAELLTFTSHVLAEPQVAAEWRARGQARVRWLGTAPARVSLSLNQGATWSTLLDGAGGAELNEVLVSVPDTTTARGRLRITPAGLSASGGITNLSAIQIVRDAPAHPAAAGTRAPSAAPPGVRRFGFALDAGRDVDGDGIPDAVIGAPLAEGAGLRGGAVWVRRGGADATGDRVLHGEQSGDQFGAAVSTGADINRDGRFDLLVGAPGNDAAGSSSGRAYLYLNGAESPPESPLQGAVAGEGFGSAVCLMSDFNADGYPDAAIASPFAAPPMLVLGTGRVRIYFGSASGVPAATSGLELTAPTGTVSFGSAMASLDLNRDGRADLAVTASSANGSTDRVLVYFGGVRPDAKPDLVLRGERAGDLFGSSLANAGDVNGDGYDDLLVGAPLAFGSNGGTGRAYLYSGGTAPASAPARIFDGTGNDESFGAAVAAAGDINRDGRADLAVGAPGAAGRLAREGAVRVFFGGSDEEPDLEWTGGQSGGSFGSAVSGAGDSDGDGFGELLVGSPLHTYAGSSATGRVSRLDAPRFVLESPAAATRWFAGGRYAVTWRGAERAELELSLDAGRTWATLASGAGGQVANTFELIAPTVEADSCFVRIRSSRPGDSLSTVLRGPLGIGRAVQVSRFDYELTDEGIRLGWETQPALGAQGLSAYRVYRERDGMRERVGPEAIEAGELLVSEFERGAAYVLAGVDGNGAEAELARVTVAGPAAKLRVWPVPSGEFGNVELAVHPPVDGSGRTWGDFAVTVYDVNGRAVRRLVAGVVPTRVGEVRAHWDRRNSDGAQARAGVYFVRAESPFRGFRIERRLVVLR